MRLNHSGTAAGPSTTRSAQLAAVCVSLTSFDLSACALSGEVSMSEQQRRRRRRGGGEESGGGGGGGGGEGRGRGGGGGEAAVTAAAAAAATEGGEWTLPAQYL